MSCLARSAQVLCDRRPCAAGLCSVAICVPRLVPNQAYRSLGKYLGHREYAICCRTVTRTYTHAPLVLHLDVTALNAQCVSAGCACSLFLQVWSLTRDLVQALWSMLTRVVDGNSTCGIQDGLRLNFVMIKAAVVRLFAAGGPCERSRAQQASSQLLQTSEDMGPSLPPRPSAGHRQVLPLLPFPFLQQALMQPKMLPAQPSKSASVPLHPLPSSPHPTCALLHHPPVQFHCPHKGQPVLSVQVPQHVLGAVCQHSTHLSGSRRSRLFSILSSVRQNLWQAGRAQAKAMPRSQWKFHWKLQL